MNFANKNLSGISFSIIILIVSSISLFSQGQGRLSLTGTVKDNSDKTMSGARVILTSNKDTTQKFGDITNKDGKFKIENLRRGDYNIEITYVGYQKITKAISINPENQDLGTIILKQDDIKVGGVTVEGQMVRAEQKNDTTIFNADAYKVNPDATTEDLIKKMPGVTVQTDGTVKAQGEDVRRVLVDGKEFFGEDPTMALKTIPAEIIDKIQVYDRASDQAQFTGFDDGNAQKTLNIITKSDKNMGNFGKLYAGYGTENRYWAGGNVNYFKGDTRISVIGLSNNINQQNFSVQDILSATGASMSRRPGGFGGMFRGRPGGGSPGMSFGGGIGDFMVGQQNGISTTNSIGINYADSWGKNITANGSYFFNLTDNDNNSLVNRNFFTQNDAEQTYKEDNTSLTKNYNHRFNARIDIKLDSSHSLLFTPRINLQANQYNSEVDGETMISSVPVNQTVNNYNSDLSGYNIDNSLLYRYKFDKIGRTFSLQLANNVNKNSGDTRLYSQNTIFGSANNTIVIDQDGDILGDGYRMSGEINYTEPVFDSTLLQLTYRPSYTFSNSDKEVYNILPGDLQNRTLDSLLTNNFDNIYFQQRAGISLSYNTQKMVINTGIEYQDARLDGTQVFPIERKTSFSFSDFLPNARFQYNFSKTTNFRINYRTSTNSPSVSQLQDVVDNSNPILLKTGNPNLKQNYTQTLMTRLGSTDFHSASSIFGFGMISFTNDFIANSLFTARKDTIINGVPMLAGSQLSKPINIDGYMMARGFANYGLPIGFIKSNFNINGGFNYTRTPSMINDFENTANNYTINSGIVVASNISPELDFTLAYNANYSIVKNSILPQQDNNYFIHVANFKLNWILFEKLVLNTELFHNLYKGLEQEFNQEFLLWNASIGYKFLDNNAGEIRLSVYDLLGQNTSINRNVTEIYLEDLQTRVLQRYLMLTFTYNIRSFGA